MRNLHIIYGFCEDQRKAKLFNHLIQETSILRVKTIGHVANKAVFAALSYSLIHPDTSDIHWLPRSIPNKKRTVRTDITACPTISRKKYHKLDLTNEQIKQLQKVSRVYRKQHNLTLTEKNWRQHINRSAAMNEVECMFMPKRKESFFLTRNQLPTPYSICS
ncbi:hypothetical protein [Vibrio mediterranei]|uniref:hypothetical protein n=1 Tax=Vibrio mediterranei TaxID=689 RepID=UPI00148E4016|nr:hypothetical protein [Vibrio mediterranei]NOI26698.1 hypothetical protein [Vibrio mediterranei]